jgi:atypical dual specificity phosphatase
MLGRRLALLRARLLEQGLRVTWLWAWDHCVRFTMGAPRIATSRLTPHLLVGGQYRHRGWRRLAAAGVTGVLSLRQEFCDREAGIAPERYLRLPTPDDAAPTLEQLREGVNFIDEEARHGGAVYVHCGAGVGRAATMAAAYLVSQGMAPERAWAQIRAVRPFIRPTAPQRIILQQWAARVHGG